MNISSIGSKTIRADNLDEVYDYFDTAVNQLIRTEVDQESFPVLTEFVGDLMSLIDRLDELCQDVNPRVEEYLSNKQEEAQLQAQMERMRKEIEELQRARRDRFGDQDVSSQSGSGIWSSEDSDLHGVIGGPVPADDFGTQAVSIANGIDFSFDVEDMIGDDEQVDEVPFTDEEEEQQQRQAEERKQAEEDALMEEVYSRLTPSDVFSGALEKQESGSDYDFDTEDDLYKDDSEGGDEDDDDDDLFAGAYLPPDAGYRYEDDDEDEADDYGRPGGPAVTDEDDFYGSDDGYGRDGYDRSPAPRPDDRYDDGYGDDYDDDEDDYRGGSRQQDDDYDDWDEGDDPLGGNIDRLLSSANMTL